MKKTIAFILMLVLLLPAQAFAAGVSTKEVDKQYFGDYSAKVKEVRTAQKNLSNLLGSDVYSLTAQYKAATVKYREAVKSKSSKDVLTQIQNEKVKLKKQLAAAKAALAAKIKPIKQESNKSLSNIAARKSKLVSMIKKHMSKKDSLSEADFNKAVTEGVAYINSTLESTLAKLKNP